MGQTQKQACSPARPAQAFRAAAGAKGAENSLDSLYEVVRAQQPHEGCPLSPQQVELICNVIGEGVWGQQQQRRQPGCSQEPVDGHRTQLYLPAVAENIKLEDLGLNPALGQVRGRVWPWRSGALQQLLVCRAKPVSCPVGWVRHTLVCG